MKDLLEHGKESDVLSDLSNFNCSRDIDVQKFIRETSVPYEKAHKSRTYLIVNQDSIEKPEMEIIAYFTIAIDQMMLRDDLSNTKKRNLRGLFNGDKVPCFLLGQLARNDKYPDSIDGNMIIQYAINALLDVHEMIGGRVVRVDCKNECGLLEFYENNGFKKMPGFDDHGHCQLVRFFDKIQRNEESLGNVEA